MIRDTSAQDRTVARQVNHSRRYVYLGAGVGVALLLMLGVPTVARLISSDATISGTRLRIAEVKRGTLVRDVSVQGRVVAAISPTLYSTNAGTVTLQINAGDKVSKGQVLAEVESPELTNKLSQEQSTMSSLQVDVERAEIDSRSKMLVAQKALDQAGIDRQTAAREVERNEKAFKSGAIPELNVLRAKDALAKADLDVAHATADLKLQRDSLGFEVKAKRLALERQKYLAQDLSRQVDELKVRSPVDGQVGQLIVQQRANVAANAPLLTVIDLSALEIEVLIPETFAHDLAIGMPAEIQEGGTKFAGEVSAVSPEVVNSQVTGRVRFSKDKPVGLRQNQRLTTRILVDEHPNVLMVERGPFVDSGAGRVAYVLHDGVAERRAIQVGATSLNAVELVSGVKEGERLVISSTDEFKGAATVSVQ